MRSQGQAIRMLGHGFIAASRAASILGLTTTRIYQLLNEQRLRGQRVGRSWYVDLRSLRDYLTADVPPDQQPEAVLCEVDRLLGMRAVG